MMEDKDRVELALKMLTMECPPLTAPQDFAQVVKAALYFLQRNLLGEGVKEEVGEILSQSVDKEIRQLRVEAQAFRDIRDAFFNGGEKNVLAFASRVREVLVSARKGENHD